ncbi:MAG: hypothetical protein DIU55_003270 [Bacillota bacterium]|nr:MAG: hypothetical protein DIU55_09590 [Bacillota bacterium]
MSLPLVLIGCPVRNRARVLPAYLSTLEALDYPPELLRFAFVLNDSVDESEEILCAFAGRRPTALLRRDLGFPRWQRGYYSYENLALLRNLLIEEALRGGADYLFSVDSDVLPPPHTLRRLLAAGKPIIGARVPNDLHLPGEHWRCNFLRADARGRLRHPRAFPSDALMPVDVVGAAVLIARAVLEAGCRYAPAPTGEDEGFCRQAMAAGFQPWVDTGLVCRHLMREGDG